LPREQQKPTGDTAVSLDPAVLLVYGGTFDPVHRGHVAVAKAAADVTAASRVLLIPCGDPPHRDKPMATGALRAELLRLAFADDPRFVVDQRELARAGPSFMVDTLADIRAEIGASAPLALLVGQDAARGLPRWHAWLRLPTLAHLLVVPRAGDMDALEPAVTAAWRLVDDVSALSRLPAGLVFRLPLALSDASATASRQALAAGDNASADLPNAVSQRLAKDSPYRVAEK